MHTRSVFTGRVGPRRLMGSIRFRLTALYATLFLLCGGSVLGLTYVLMRHAKPVAETNVHVAAPPGSPPAGIAVPASVPEPKAPDTGALDAQRAAQLDQLLVRSLAALGATSAVSIGAGWIMAGRVLRPVRTVTNITRRISHDDLHERLNLPGRRDELVELGDTIDDLLARLEAAFEAQRRFVANVSHELRTPLAMMRTSLDVATAKPCVSSEVVVLDGRLRQGLDRADRLVAGFLELSGAQCDQSSHQAVVMEDAVTAALADASESITRRHLHVRFEGANATVTANPMLLRSLVSNLVTNAVCHNIDGGLVEIRVDDTSDTCRLIVENDGPSLDPDRLASLSEPFATGTRDRTGRDGGHGLGLAIVAAVVQAHRGRLSLHARAHGGLRVEVELPRTTGGATLR